ncbi:MAG: metallophosphoesterase [Colwellia sp.]|nr:metallophosphoesterase [Colwellia sp.]MCW8863370.1 metallophosphoesterase [Colwellia sp.]MCW9080027.1 metallophosphoesterase [Colwellia sp.]
MKPVVKATNPLVIAQFSDSHLFADPQGLHHGSNVFLHLQQVLADIAKRADIDLVVFSGDLSQDHSEQSYQNFARAVSQAKLGVRVYYLAGNHDEQALLTKHLNQAEFCQDKTITANAWQLHLLDSKSGTPAGFVRQEELSSLKAKLDKDKFHLLVMHHHPVDVGYFIDRHGLTNQVDFWQAINEMQHSSIKIEAIACGHVHRAIVLPKQALPSKQSVDVYTCPATSIAFDPSKESVSSLNLTPSYRLFYLYQDGHINSEIISPR